MLEPSARNSNLLPVNANGLLGLRSPPSIGSGGRTGVPRPRNDSGVDSPASPRSIASNTFSSSAPRKIEMIAGGASLAPSRGSFRGAAVAAGDVLHHHHRQLLMIGADVRVLEDRSELVLVRGDLVVARLDRHAEL